MLNNPLLRLVIALGIAVPIVYALFMLMNYLISVKEVKLDQSEQRVLSAITPQQQDSDVRVRQRSKPKRLDSAQKPPPGIPASESLRPPTCSHLVVSVSACVCTQLSFWSTFPLRQLNGSHGCGHFLLKMMGCGIAKHDLLLEQK